MIVLIFICFQYAKSQEILQAKKEANAKPPLQAIVFGLVGINGALIQRRVAVVAVVQECGQQGWSGAAALAVQRRPREAHFGSRGLGAMAQKEVDEHRVELGIARHIQAMQGLIVAQRFAVGAARGHGIQGIGNADDAAPLRYVLPRPAKWIAAASKAFVVRQNRFGDGGITLEAEPEAGADFRVHPDFAVFQGCKSSPFV